MSLERFTRKQIVVARVGEPVAQVARRMAEQHVGAVVVVDGRQPVGIITDRDLVSRVLAAGLDANTPVESVMSAELVTVRQDELIDQVAFTMRKHGVRRVPIVDAQGALVGLVSLDDLYVLLAGELATTAHAVVENRGP